MGWVRSLRDTKPMLDPVLLMGLPCFALAACAGAGSVEAGSEPGDVGWDASAPPARDGGAAGSDAGAPDASASDVGASFVLRWSPSLTFESVGPAGVPLPNNAMNMATHRGSLFVGMATVREPAGHSDNRSYVYRLDSAEGRWILDATFPPDTGRVDALESVRFATDHLGAPLASPVELLLASTNWASRTAYPVRVYVRDDEAGQWIETTVGAPLRTYEARQLAVHRDQVTGVDLVFVAASDAPLGIYAAGYDASAPGRLRWRREPELLAEVARGEPKWFGLAEANGALYASNRVRSSGASTGLLRVGRASRISPARPAPSTPRSAA